MSADGLEDVGAEAPAPPAEVVDDDKASLQLTRPADVVGDGDAVLDHRRGDVAVVPHQPVEVRHVDHEDVGIVDRVPRVGG